MKQFLTRHLRSAAIVLAGGAAVLAVAAAPASAASNSRHEQHCAAGTHGQSASATCTNVNRGTRIKLTALCVGGRHRHTVVASRLVMRNHARVNLRVSCTRSERARHARVSISRPHHP